MVKLSCSRSAGIASDPGQSAQQSRQDKGALPLCTQCIGANTCCSGVLQTPPTMLVTHHSIPCWQAVYVRTAKNVLIEVNPQVRLPRTFKRFCGLMVQLLQKLSIRASNGSQKLLKVCSSQPSHNCLLYSLLIWPQVESKLLAKSTAACTSLACCEIRTQCQGHRALHGGTFCTAERRQPHQANGAITARG